MAERLFDHLTIDNDEAKLDGSIIKNLHNNEEFSTVKEDFTDMVNSAYVTDSASGGIAHFEDGANNVPIKSLKVNIVPVQSGSGDPSPSNVRPISGWNAVKVTRTGKNLLDTSNMSTASISGVTYSRSDDGVITVGGKATAGAYKQIAQFKTINGVQYTITGSPSGAASGKYRMTVAGYGYEYGSGYTFTGDGNTHVITLDVYAGYPDSDTLTFKPMIRLASIADDIYEPYNGTTYDVSLESAGTVYGGTLDVTSGELTVDRAMVIVNGTETIFTENANRFYIKYSDSRTIDLTNQNTDASVMCDRLKSTTWVELARADNLACAPAWDHGIAFRDDTITTAQGWKDYFTANPTQFSYALATPQTYQLTPTEVKSLLGINNVWSDAGDVEVEYRADTKLYIDKRIAEVTS